MGSADSERRAIGACPHERMGGCNVGSDRVYAWFKVPAMKERLATGIIHVTVGRPGAEHGTLLMFVRTRAIDKVRDLPQQRFVPPDNSRTSPKHSRKSPSLLRSRLPEPRQHGKGQRRRPSSNGVLARKLR